MKKMKMFFVAAALMLVTVGVFAGKAKFFTDTDLYYYDPSALKFNAISTSITLAPGFSVTATDPGANAVLVTVNGVNGSSPMALYTFVSGTPGQYEYIQN